MSPSHKRKIGDIGEEVACKYLAKQRYIVLERNYLRPWGEIDIVAEKRGKLRFVEVKAISCEMGAGKEGYSVRPEDNMHPGKLKRLHRAIQTYLLDHKVPEEKEWQIDLACVFLDFNAKRARVEMIENVVF
jgi:putative endonuclease